MSQAIKVSVFNLYIKIFGNNFQQMNVFHKYNILYVHTYVFQNYQYASWLLVYPLQYCL